MAEEVNDKLHEQGQITIAELTKTYDLPADFLAEVSAFSLLCACVNLCYTCSWQCMAISRGESTEQHYKLQKNR